MSLVHLLRGEIKWSLTPYKFNVKIPLAFTLQFVLMNLLIISSQRIMVKQ